MRRILLAALGAVALLLAIAAGAVYWFLSHEGIPRAVEQQATGWLGQPVRIGDASVAFFPRVALRLRNVTAGEPVRFSLAAVDVSMPLWPLLSRRVENAELTVSDSRVEMPLPFSLFRNVRREEPDVAGTADNPLRIVSVRTIRLRDVTIASRNREIAVSADSSIDGSRLMLERFTATSGETYIDATGRIELGPRVDATIEAQASSVDIDDLLALAAAFTDGRSALAPSSGARLSATITAPRGRLAGVPFTRFDAALWAEGGQVTVEPFTFDIFGGRHNGWVEAQLGDRLEARVGMSLSNIDVAQLAAFGGAPRTVTGRLSGSGRFGASGPDVAAILSSARGVGEVAVTDGAIRGLDIVTAAVRVLAGAPAADATAAPASNEAGATAPDAPARDGRNAAATSGRFDHIAATFALADGVIHTDDLALRAPDVTVFARGRVTLQSGALDGRADVVLSETLSAGAGRDLYRYTRAGNRIVLPATLGGTVARPTLGLAAAAALRRGIRNEIERRLKSLLPLPF